MPKSSLHQILHNLISSGQINNATGQTVTAGDYSSTCYITKSDGLGIPWFESDGGASSYVESLPIGFNSIKG